MRTTLILRAVAVLALAGLVAAGRPVKAQTQRRVFEVASIKRNTSNSESTVRVEGTRFRAINEPAFWLVALAYSEVGAPPLRPFQIIGAPAWLESERYDIVAQVAGDPPARDSSDIVAMRPFLRSLFEDRFRLQVHREQRPMSIYALVRREDTRLGPRLKPSTIDCSTPPARCALEGGPYGLVKSEGITMETLAQALAGATERVVLDRTNLTGWFAVNLEWSPDQSARDARPSLFTAIREQLGLDLEPGTGPVDVVVIDHVERPTPN